MKAFDERIYRDRVNALPFVRLMGMRLLASKEGRSVMTCRIRPALKNSAGVLHGGVAGALVDMSVATALRSVMPLKARMTTVEYKVNFLSPVAEGTVTALGTILRLGKTIASGTAEIRNGEGEIVAFGSATFYLFHPRGGSAAAAIIEGKTKAAGRRRA